MFFLAGWYGLRPFDTRGPLGRQGCDRSLDVPALCIDEACRGGLIRRGCTLACLVCIRPLPHLRRTLDAKLLQPLFPPRLVRRALGWAPLDFQGARGLEGLWLCRVKSSPPL